MAMPTHGKLRDIALKHIVRTQPEATKLKGMYKDNAESVQPKGPYDRPDPEIQPKPFKL